MVRFSIIGCARHERRQMYYWSGTFICVVGVLLLILIIFRNFSGDQRFVPTFVGGYCAVFATLMSLFQILEHLTCFSDPECQTKIVRILFMVPLYAMISWICLLAPGAAEYLNLIRDAYESYVIYAFFQLMIALMGGTDTVYRALMIEERPPIQPVFPLCCLQPIRVTPTFVRNCRLCLFQFMLVKPTVTVVIIILTANDKMGTNIANITQGYFWTTLVYNISITTAFTALLYFYMGLKDFLAGQNALMKLFCIKAVIFLSFWQGLFIQLLALTNLLPSFPFWSDAAAPTALQDLLICVEMMFVAFAHRYCFGSDEYALDSPVEENGYEDACHPDDIPSRTIPAARYSVSENLKYTLKHEDILLDMKNIVWNR